MNKIILFFLLMIASSSFAEIVENVSVRAIVISFDKEEVKIKNDMGKTFEIPRSYIQNKKLEAGKSNDLQMSAENFKKFSSFYNGLGK